MASRYNTLLSFFLFFALVAVASSQLSANFYSTSCPTALNVIQKAVNAAVAQEKRMGASLLRLFFHDCFVQGCDGSVLLVDTASFTGEQTAFPNVNSLRGFNVINSVKAQVEAVCKQTVSCADIVALAARDSVVALGGRPWAVLLGRRDSTTASLSQANTDLPSPASDLSNLTSAFAKKGLSTAQMVALSGAHTIGQARCVTFRNRIYNDANINQAFATSLQANCPATSGNGDSNLDPIDTQTPTTFDNDYYQNLLVEKGLFHSDQALFNNGSTDALVKTYSQNQVKFQTDFINAMIAMGNISPLTGSQGEIRLNCSLVN